MVVNSLVIQLLNGLASASALFLVASGLSIIFGVTRIVNFAHGSFYMLGAYVAFSITRALPVEAFDVLGELGPHVRFWGGIATAALVVGLVGIAIEIAVLRRIYHAPELFQLLATFGIVLIVQDATLAIWGPENLVGPRAPGLRGAVYILDQRFPQYELLLIAIGPAMLGLLWLLFHRTRWGTLVRAATLDREMVAALGVDQRKLFTGVFLLGAALAGLGGALQLPRETLNLQMDLSIIADVFVVTVVGGMGSVVGAYLAALLIAELQALMLLAPPFTIAGIEIAFAKLTLIPSFLVMAAVLIVRPYGLLGRPQAAARVAGAAEPVLRLATPELTRIGLAALAALALLPLAFGDYTVAVATEIAIFVLFTASLHFIMGPGGMASFGHAAYFGLGAYACGLAVKYWAAPMGVGLAFAPVLAGLGGLLFGWFTVRLSGVYLAMLTLAFAQIVWSIVFQSDALTGGDNGIRGVWPDEWARDKAVYYALAVALCIAGTLLLRRIIYAPFGYALRAGRDSPLRAEAIGIDVRRVQWIAFAVSALFAGIAGGLFAYLKGSVFPTYVSIPKSVDALVRVLLGGVQTVSGPIVGAIVFTGLEEQLARATEYWRAVLGVVIILLVLAFPEGLAGFAQRRWERWRGGGE
ncbi:MAG: ABC transporter permease [Alphaproteobacteria bacterium]|nr:ABC transporter permease [Alphaproteobacteria bacterium]